MHGMAGVAAQLPRATMPASALRLLGDDRLFRLASGGDSRAFEVIYERHHQALYRYCRSIVGNAEDAADALQSTMASALRGLAGEQRKIPLRPWLFRIAHNESVTLLRKRRPHVTIDDALELEAPAHDPEVKQRLEDLVADLRELPDAQRGALVMHELSDLPYRDVATALDTTEPHARQLVYEARTALHDLAEGRAMECDHVRRTLSDGDRRVLRGRRIRSHLRTCSDCAAFERVIGTRKRDLAMIAPPLPAVLAAGVLHNLLGGAGSAGTSAAASSAGSASIGSVIGGKVLAASAVSKVAAAVAITVAAGAGAVEIVRTQNTSHTAGSPASGQHSAGHTPSAAKGNPVSVPAGSGVRHGGGGISNSHGQRGSAAGHTRPAHPLHPVRPSHRTHPLHPAKPTHPPKPTHPSHATSPKAGSQRGASTPRNAAPQTHPTSPANPVPKSGSQLPASTTLPLQTGDLGTQKGQAGSNAGDLLDGATTGRRGG
jgi:RNA polymerase sigma factor (sigma-70 family)